jgi:SNF2 family DNA or RNA helicase
MVKNISVKSFDVLCIDELSSFKSHESKRVAALSKILHRFEYRWGLTGTPVPNGYLDLFSQIYMIDPNIFGDNFWRFRNKYFHEITKFRWGLSDGSKEKIDEKIKDITISMRAQDYLTMPEKIINDIKIQMDEKTSTIYKKALYQIVYDKQTKEIDLSGNLIIKLQQLSNGFIYLDDTRKYDIVHTLMINRLEELLDTITGNTLLFYSFITDKEIILDKFNAIHLQHDQDFINWNDGNIKLAIAHPNSLAYGVNLQTGGNNIIWYGLNYSQELYEQANARLYRQGQKIGVLVHNLYVTGTIQDRIKMILEGKIKQSDLLFEAVKYVKEL